MRKLSRRQRSALARKGGQALWAKIRALAAASLLLAVAGCAPDTKIRVVSNTSWVGRVNGGSVSGTGDRAFTLRPDHKCFDFQKLDSLGDLRVEYLRGHGDDLLPPRSQISVSGCAD